MYTVRTENKAPVERLEASNPSASEETLLDLSYSEDAEVRRRVASNLATPKAVLRKLALDSEGSVRARVGLNPSCPVELSEEIANDTDIEVFLSLSESFQENEAGFESIVDKQNPLSKRLSTRFSEVLSMEKWLEYSEFRYISEFDYYLGELLVAAGIVKESCLMFLMESARKWNVRLGVALVVTGTLDASIVSKALQCQLNLRLHNMELEEAIKCLSAVSC